MQKIYNKIITIKKNTFYKDLDSEVQKEIVNIFNTTHFESMKDFSFIEVALIENGFYAIIANAFGKSVSVNFNYYERTI